MVRYECGRVRDGRDTVSFTVEAGNESQSKSGKLSKIFPYNLWSVLHKNFTSSSSFHLI